MDNDKQGGNWFATHWYWILAIVAGVVVAYLYIWPMISGFIGNLFSGLGSAGQTTTPAVPSAGTVSGSGSNQTGATTSGNSQAMTTLTTELSKLETQLTLTGQNEKALQQSLTQQISTLKNQIGTLSKKHVATAPTTVKRTKPTPVMKKVGKQLTHIKTQATDTAKQATLGIGKVMFKAPASTPTYLGVHTGPKKPTMRVKTHVPKLVRKSVSHVMPEALSVSHPSVVKKPMVKRGVGKIMRIS